MKLNECYNLVTKVREQIYALYVEKISRNIVKIMNSSHIVRTGAQEGKKNQGVVICLTGKRIGGANRGAPILSRQKLGVRHY